MATRPLALRLAAALAVVAGTTALAPLGASAAPRASEVIGPGDRGPAVRVVQRQLTRLGFRTSADGRFGPATRAAVTRFESRLNLRVDGRLTRFEQRVLRRRAARQGTNASAARASGPTPPDASQEVPGAVAQLTPDGYAIPPADAPPVVKAIIRSGNEIARAPYKYGGGHGRWKDSGYDCSGSVSYALHGAGLLDQPMASGGFASWGDAGPGRWVTIYANGGHMYMVVAGLRFDTTARRETGTRWSAEMRSPAGFAVRNP